MLVIKCLHCGTKFEKGPRPNQKYCSDKHKQAAHTARRRAKARLANPPKPNHNYNGNRNSTLGRIQLGDMDFIKSLGFETKAEALAALRKWEKAYAIDGAMMERWYRKTSATDDSQARSTGGY